MAFSLLMAAARKKARKAKPHLSGGAVVITALRYERAKPTTPEGPLLFEADVQYLLINSSKPEKEWEIKGTASNKNHDPRFRPIVTITGDISVNDPI
jgi:hypothetical protein